MPIFMLLASVNWRSALSFPVPFQSEPSNFQNLLYDCGFKKYWFISLWTINVCIRKNTSLHDHGLSRTGQPNQPRAKSFLSERQPNWTKAAQFSARRQTYLRRNILVLSILICSLKRNLCNTFLVISFTLSSCSSMKSRCCSVARDKISMLC